MRSWQKGKSSSSFYSRAHVSRNRWCILGVQLADRTLLSIPCFSRLVVAPHELLPDTLQQSMVSQSHSYHLVDPSPWPIAGSLGALATTVGGVMFMHSFNGGEQLLRLGSIFLPYSMCLWWRDVLRESTFEGHHTQVVQTCMVLPPIRPNWYR